MQREVLAGAVLDLHLKAVTPEQVVDELTYRSYAHNRRAAPHITAEQWAKCWPGAEQLEVRFQAELAIAKAAS